MTIPEIDTATALMLVGCGIASITDATTGKILNVLTGPLVLGGLIINASLGDWQFGFWGLVLATQIHLPMYFLGIEKGGDVKLLMGIGACMGPAFILNTSFWYACLYLVIGPLVLLYRRRLKNLLVVGKHLAEQGLRSGIVDSEVQVPTPTILWTAPVIFGAALAAWLSNYPTEPGLGMVLVKILAIVYVGGWALYQLVKWNFGRRG